MVAVLWSELELVWPAALFVQEARALLDAGECDDNTMGWLLAESFHDDVGREFLRQAITLRRRTEDADPWSDQRPDGPAPAEVSAVGDLIRAADTLPRFRPRRYYSARHDPRPEPLLALSDTRAAFARVIGELSETGYFESAFGSTCVDAGDDDPDGVGQQRLAQALNLDAEQVRLWPVRRDGQPTRAEDTSTGDLFYDVIEALHDFVARPRRRYWHDYGREWDYADFSRSSGRAVYRWRVNELLTRSEVPLRLAESGSDIGLLVHAAGDPRDELVDRALATPAGSDRAEVEHAIGLFRRRGGTREDKRGAIFALARILESRRGLIHANFVSGDEDALFQIANTFDLRHRKANQRPDYPDAYLDWVFWWYLATVELTDRLVARQVTPGG